MSPLKSDRSGLTLLELVVVLGILAIIAGVTIQSLEPIADQARYDATLETLDAFQRAVYQEQQLAADRVVVRGFVADMGRPPIAVGADPLLQAAELWDRAATIATARPFAVHVYPDPEIDDLEARVAAGWKGPYLQPPRDGRLSDGWGRAFDYAGDGTILPSGERLRTVRSRGSDGLFDPPSAIAGSNNSADLPRIPPDLDGQIHATIEVQVLERSGDSLVPAAIDAGSRLYVFIFGPSDGAPTRLFPPVGGYEPDHSSPIPELFIPIGEDPATRITAGPRTFVTWIARGTWPDLAMDWSDERTVTLLPGNNVIQIVKTP